MMQFIVMVVVLRRWLCCCCEGWSVVVGIMLWCLRGCCEGCGAVAIVVTLLFEAVMSFVFSFFIVLQRV